MQFFVSIAPFRHSPFAFHLMQLLTIESEAANIFIKNWLILSILFIVGLLFIYHSITIMEEKDAIQTRIYFRELYYLGRRQN